jgi:hypothetical protein
MMSLLTRIQRYIWNNFHICPNQTAIAKAAEQRVGEILSSLGCQVKYMNHLSPFDLLIDANIRVDVKTTTKPTRGNNCYVFNVRRGTKRDDCDFYVLEIGNDYFVIPSTHVPRRQYTITIAWPGLVEPKEIGRRINWRNYHNCWGQIVWPKRTYETLPF